MLSVCVCVGAGVWRGCLFVCADPPDIVTRPRDLNVKAGGVAAFVCGAKGSPRPNITWRKNGKRVSGSQSRYVLHDFPGGALLRIEPVRAQRDDASYECVAENGVGDAVSAEAVLTIYEGEYTFMHSCKWRLSQFPLRIQCFEQVLPPKARFHLYVLWNTKLKYKTKYYKFRIYSYIDSFLCKTILADVTSIHLFLINKLTF